MIAGAMLRLRRRRNYVLAAVALSLITYLTLSRRDELLTRIMTTETGTVVTAKPPAAPDLPARPAEDITTRSAVEDITTRPAVEDTTTRPAEDTTTKPPSQAAPTAVSTTTSSPPKPEDTGTIKAADLLREDPTPLKSSPQSAQKLMAPIPMSYGTASHPPLSDVATGIADLPHRHLPSESNPSNRLVIIGDVHGQLAALQSLLAALSFDRATDHLILTGDLVSKGPDSPGVVQLAMDLSASAVRGNHEDRVLLAHRESLAKPTPSGDRAWLDALAPAGTGTDDPSSPPPAPEPSPGTEADVSTARRLSPAQLRWLAELPIILRLGPLPPQSPVPWNAGTVAVVHAGLVPGVPLERQDLRAAMNMRTLVYPAEEARRDAVRKQLEREIKGRLDRMKGARKVEGKVGVQGWQVDDEIRRLEAEMGFDRGLDRQVWFPVDGREGVAWGEVWSREMAGRAEGDRTVVVYGHDAKRGLKVREVEEEGKGKGKRDGDAKGEGENDAGTEKRKVERYAFGLDSGCVYGKQLSAMVLERGEDGGVRHRIVQVECEKAVDLKTEVA